MSFVKVLHNNTPDTGSGSTIIAVTDPTQAPTDPDATANPNPTNQTQIIDPLNPENLPYAFYFIAGVVFIMAIVAVTASNQQSKKRQNRVTWKRY